jgi:TonB family protein
VACFLLLSGPRPVARSRQLTWIEVEPLKKKIEASKKEAESLSKKVVQSNAGEETKKAAPDAFLGEKTRVVDRQTVSSKKLTVMGVNAKPRLAAKPAKTQPTTEPSKDKGKESPKALSSFGLPILPEARKAGAPEAFAKDEPRWANIGVQPQDYVDGVKASDRTALNTREYAYFGYHQRIRQRLELQWTRMLKETLTKFYRGGRHLASETEYVTKVVVILNSQGEITKVKVIEMSGTQELDQVAVDAFNRAGPFPNPPNGLIRNGEVEVPWELRLRS